MTVIQQLSAHFSQQMFLMLSASRFWKFFDHTSLSDPEYPFRDLVSSQNLANPLLHFDFSRSGSRSSDAQERRHDFTITLVGQADDADFGNGWMVQDAILNFSGENIFTA